MFLVRSSLRNKDGHEIECAQVTARNLAHANAAASAWGRGRLESSDDPDAYVEHVWTQRRAA
jgi:hypothetical protein